MKKLIVFLLLQFVVYHTVFAQNATPDGSSSAAGATATDHSDNSSNANPSGGVGATTPPTCTMDTYKGQLFVFNGNIALNSCDAVGGHASTIPSIIMYKGTVFDVVGLLPSCQLIIRLRTFKQYADQLTYNFQQGNGTEKQTAITTPKLSDDQLKIVTARLTPNTTQYYLLNQSDYAGMCSPFTYQNRFSITLGTFITPFKFRPTKSIFTSNLSLGAAAYFNWLLNTNNSVGFVVGISATSVILDSLSTKGKVRTDTERPALTPSLSFVYTYKMINFTLGGGIDYVNKTSLLEQSWIFNGKPWIGFGIGVSLFSSSTSSNATPQTSLQK